MSVPGVNAVGSDLTTLLRLSGHGPLAGASASSIAAAVASAADPARVEKAAPPEAPDPTALNLLAAGDAPDDASIGLYSSEIGDPQGAAGPDSRGAAGAEDALASELQATAVLDEQLLSQSLDESVLAKAESAAHAPPSGAILEQPGAAGEIDRRLALTLPSASPSAAGDVLKLMQAIEAGDAANAAAVAARLQTGLAGLATVTANGAPVPSSAANEPAALLSQLQSLAAPAQAGDMTGAAALARAIQALVQAAPAPQSDALLTLLAPARGLPIFSPDANPILMAMQWSQLATLAATLERLRKLREDRLKILAVAALGSLHHDESREDD